MPLDEGHVNVLCEGHINVLCIIGVAPCACNSLAVWPAMLEVAHDAMPVVVCRRPPGLHIQESFSIMDARFCFRGIDGRLLMRMMSLLGRRFGSGRR